MSATSRAASWRGEGAKTKPTAEAPSPTASSASSSVVTPQILTKNRSDGITARRPVTLASSHRADGAARGSAARTSASPTRIAS